VDKVGMLGCVLTYASDPKSLMLWMLSLMLGRKGSRDILRVLSIHSLGKGEVIWEREK
jgi:hypothetical protein